MILKPSSKPTLLVLAAGLSSRYGSLKQLDRFGPSGERLVDYAIFDAIRAGFGKVVFVLSRDTENEFGKCFAHRWSDSIKISYAFQEVDTIPSGFRTPHERQKPWGTGHAVLVAAPQIDEPFAVINADDFYGAEALKMIGTHLSGGEPEYCVVGYRLANTLSQHGPVSRAICTTNESGYLKGLTEVTGIFDSEDGIAYRNEKGEVIGLHGQSLVSMNLMGFTPSVFNDLSRYFVEFLREYVHDLTAEFYLPHVVNSLVATGSTKVRVLPSTSNWLGVTYREDKISAIKKIRELVKMGVYPEKLRR